MDNKYIKVPRSISINVMANNNYSLSSSQYKDLVIGNNNFLLVRDFLSRPLKRSDLGDEVGSISYIKKSQYYFMRTKALQSHSFLPDITSETALPILPKAFKSSNLKKNDLIISKDSNIGEIVILEKDYPNIMLSGALYKLPVIKNKYYLLAFLKHQIFREQLDFVVPKGATIRHAKTMFLDCKIPMPTENAQKTLIYVEHLMKAICEKERLIKERHKKIIEIIEKELKENQKNNKMTFNFPTINDIRRTGRLDTNLYREDFKKIEFLIKNYSGGFKNIFDLSFTLSRGQNLQLSNIGKSIYEDKDHKGFYTLMLPKFLSKYGTVDFIKYLGSPKKLKTLKKGDLIFGAEGFEKGRSIVIVDEDKRTITNIHGITIQQKNGNLTTSIFVKCILDFLRNKGLIDLFAVGGNGGSLAQKYWNVIPFPIFSEVKRNEIASLYYNSKNIYDTSKCYLDNFLETDAKYNATAGILNLDKASKKLQKKLNHVIGSIIDNKKVDHSYEI